MLNDITRIDTGVSILGVRLETPIMVAPFGRHRLFHPDGERATGRGAAAAGSVFVLPAGRRAGSSSICRPTAR